MIAKWLYPWVYTGVVTAGMATVVIGRQALGRDREYMQRETRRWARRLARSWGLEVRTFGREHVTGEPCVLMANHQSHTDIVALIEALPIVPGFLAKKELRRIPFLGAAMEVGGHVFIDRTHRSKAFEAIAEAAASVRAGTPIVIFPEGTRGDDEAISPFKKGGFHLARQARVPIVPIGIRGTRRILPKHGRRLCSGTVEVHIGSPIPAEDVQGLTLPDLMARVRTRIADLSGLPRVEELTPTVHA